MEYLTNQKGSNKMYILGFIYTHTTLFRITILHTLETVHIHPQCLPVIYDLAEAGSAYVHGGGKKLMQ